MPALIEEEDSDLEDVKHQEPAEQQDKGQQKQRDAIKESDQTQKEKGP